MKTKKRSKTPENIIEVDLKGIIKGSQCPNCGKTTRYKYRPFCSQRCVQLDLGHWLNEDYRFPAVEYDTIDDLENDEPD